MSAMRDSVPPASRPADDREPGDPKSILAAIRRLFDARRERRSFDRAGPIRPGRRPLVPTFFAFEVLDLIGDRRAGQRRDGRSGSSGDFTIVVTLSLLGLALSLLAIGMGGLIDPEYMATLLFLF